MNRRSYIFLTLLFLLSNIGHTLGQIESKQANLVYMLTTDFGSIEEIWSYNPLRGYEYELVANLKQDNNSIRDIEFDWENEQIYLLRVEGEYKGFVFLGMSHIVRLDMETLQEEIIYSRWNITDIELSPNGKRAFLKYYPDSAEEITRDNLQTQRICFIELSISEPDCHNETFDQEFPPYALTWLDNDWVVFRAQTIPDRVKIHNVSAREESVWTVR